jgi:hypothetical protein
MAEPLKDPPIERFLVATMSPCHFHGSSPTYERAREFAVHLGKENPHQSFFILEHKSTIRAKEVGLRVEEEVITAG